ncbi:MAG TPA: serine/threonine-protein kinase [Ktedonobacteraceae bacterium]|nr:serine/threonine-protein kinase [Ktedonobacteraceae bacterium]
MTTTRGQHLLGKKVASYVLEQLLGYGGSSAVYLAQSPASGEKVAVKVFLPRSTMDVQMQKNFYRRFLLEAEAASKLEHPYILSIYSYGQDHGLPYIVMPYMPGGTLSEYVRKHGPLSLREAQRYLEQIASALDYAHEQGCVHCDVKPANILLDGAGNAMLSDFGIARLMQPDAPAVEKSAKPTEGLMGTPDYISPEQALGQQLDGRSDIYSLGVTLFYLLAGRPPFKAESSIAMALLHVHEAPPPLGLFRADITPEIDNVIGKALAKWPEERYQTAGEFREAFDKAIASIDTVEYSAYLAGDSGKSRPPSVILRPVAQIRQSSSLASRFSRTMLVAIVLIPLLLLSGATFGIVKLLTHAQTYPQVVPTGGTVTPSSIDILAGNQDDWQKSKTYFFNESGQYTILNTSKKDVALALYANHQYSDFRLSVTVSEIRSQQNGFDFYGLVFRASVDQSHYYLFDVGTAGDGQYTFYRYDGQWHVLASGPAPSLHTGLGQHNVLVVVAKGDTFSFFINGKPVGKPVVDHSQAALSEGEVGLCVENDNSEVVFSHMYVTQL